jgi:hypothetical protein
MTKKYEMKVAKILLSFGLIFALLAMQVASLPVGPTITHVKNETSSSAGLGTIRSGDEGGYITTISLNASQQNYAWKAYVGNITGVLTLQNALNYSIYEWSLPATNQEVYISRNGTVNWNSINCSNRGNITAEDTFLNLNSTSSNSINKTFNASVHKSFVLAGTTIESSTCPAISTYVNDAAQTSGEANKFQEVLLADSYSHLVYAALVDQDQSGFDASLYDFQAIVGEDQTSGTPTVYYFYVELA